MKKKVAQSDERQQSTKLQQVQELFRERIRRAWREELAGERDGLGPADERTIADYVHREDSIAERYVFGWLVDWGREDNVAFVPDELRQARELVHVALRAARLLEANYLDGSLPREADLPNDLTAARAFVHKAHKIITTQGPPPPMRTSTVVAAKHQRAHYEKISEAEQRRWRVAFMRCLDLMNEFEGLGNSRSLLNPILPFSLDSFELGKLESLIAAWRVTTPGAKSTSSKLGSKWEMLSQLLTDVWGCTLTAGALEREYGRYGA